MNTIERFAWGNVLR